jgi:hypothetical protein
MLEQPATYRVRPAEQHHSTKVPGLIIGLTTPTPGYREG